jgi:hypothetical protein
MGKLAAYRIRLDEPVGDNDGLIIDSTMGISDEAKLKNVQALTEAVHE